MSSTSQPSLPLNCRREYYLLGNPSWISLPSCSFFIFFRFFENHNQQRSAVRCRAVPCSAAQRCAVRCHALPCGAVLCRAVPSCAVPSCAVHSLSYIPGTRYVRITRQAHPAQPSAARCSAVRCCALPCGAVPCCAVLCYASSFVHIKINMYVH